MVVDVRPYGCFIQFDVEVEGGDKHKVYGMVHVSEVSWDYCDDARLQVKVNSCAVICMFWCSRVQSCWLHDVTVPKEAPGLYIRLAGHYHPCIDCKLHRDNHHKLRMATVPHV